jgi:hypothetical protein
MALSRSIIDYNIVGILIVLSRVRPPFIEIKYSGNPRPSHSLKLNAAGMGMIFSPYAT